jgi:HEAT repeat protein
MIPQVSSTGEFVLLALIFTVAALLGLAVLFALSTVVLRYRNAVRARELTALEERWEPLIVEFSAGSIAASDVWDAVAPDKRTHFVRVVMRYAGRIRGSARERLDDLVQPYLDDFAKLLNKSGMEDEALVIRVIGYSGLDRYEKEVVAALDNSSPLVSMVAARTLAQSGGARYAPDILNRLDRYHSWSPSYLAALLASMGADAAPALRGLFADKSELTWKRAVAADALRWLHDPAAKDVAARVLEEAVDRNLTSQSLRLFANLGGPGDGAAVVPLLDSKDFAVRASAVRAVGQLRLRETAPRLEQALREDESRWVALHAARALGELGELRVLQTLADSDHLKARLARQVLMEQGVQRWIA